jgi:uncharacterized membrane protein
MRTSITPAPISTSSEAEDGGATRLDAKVIKVELVISSILRVGVMLSASLILAGMVLSFAAHPQYARRASSLRGLTGAGATFPHSFTAVIQGTARLDGPAVVALGLLVLVATPVVRVAASVVGFVYERDRPFVAITMTVLLLLIASFVVGAAG